MGFREELQSTATNIQAYIASHGGTASLDQIDLLASILQALELTKPTSTNTDSVGATDVRDGVNASTQIQDIKTNTDNISSNIQTLYNLLNTRGLATETTLASILTQLQGDKALTEQIWTDDSDTFFIRRVSYDQDSNEYRIVYTLPNGDTYIPSTGLRPASTGSGGSSGSSIDYEVLTERYVVKTADTGYDIGDRLVRTVIYDVSTIPATLKSTFWYNLNASTVVTPDITDLTLDNGEQIVVGSDVVSDTNPIPIKAGTGVTLPVSLASFSGLTDTQLRANPLFVNQSGGWTVGISGTPNVTVTNTGFTSNLINFNGAPFSATNALPIRFSDGTNLLTSVPSSQVGTWNVGQSGVWNVGINGTPDVNIVNTPAVTISGNAGVNITQFGGTSLSGTNPIPIRLSNGSGFLSALPVSQNGTWNVGLTGSLPTGTNSIGAVTQDGIWNVGITGTPSVSISGTPTVNVSGNTGVNLTQVSGSNISGTNPVPIRLSDGTSFLTNLPVSQNGTWNLNNISGSISLPTGAATSALQTSGNTSLTNINNKLPSLFNFTNKDAIPVAIVDATGTQITSFGGGGGGGANTEYQEGSTVASPYGQIMLWKDSGNSLKAVSSSTPLPITGSIVLATGSNVIGSISNTSFAVTQSGNWGVRIQDGVGNGIESNTTNPTGTERGLIVRNIPSGTQTISGTVTANLGTLNGVATETTLSALNNKIPTNLTVNSTRLLVDGSGVTQPVSISGNIGTNITQLGGSAPAAANPLPIRLSDGTSFLTSLAVSQSGTWDLNNISGTISLPTGAATETTLAALNTKTPALGQALAAASVPVVLTAAQLTTLTPPTSVSLNTGSNVIGSISNTSFASTQSGTWNINNVSGTVSLPTGAATSALQTTGNSSLSSIDSKLPALGQALAAGSVPVVLTASQLSTLTPLSTVASTQSGTWTVQPGNTPNTTPWLTKISDGTNSVSLFNLTNSKPIPTAIVDGSGNQITSFGGGTQYTEGATQATPTGTVLLWKGGSNVLNSVSASNPLPVSASASQSGTWNITNISGTISLPTGAATSAKQDTGNTSLASIDTKTPSLGQALAAASVPVVLPSAQITTLTPPTSVGLNAGSNTIGNVLNQYTRNGSNQTVVLDTSTASNNRGIPIINLAGDSLSPYDVGAGAITGSTQRIALANDHILDQYITGQGSQTALNNNILLATAGTGSIDCQQYRSIYIQINAASGTFSTGGISFECSNDNVNWMAANLREFSGGNQNINLVSTYAPATSTIRYFGGSILYRYFRARISSGITGTTTGVQAFTTLRMAPFADILTSVSLEQYANAAIGASNAVHVRPGTSATWTLNTRHEAASTPVSVRLTDGSAFTTPVPLPATGTTSNVAAATSSTTLTASNTARRGFMVHNDSTAILYLKLGSTASNTSYTVKLPPDAYWEMPYLYTGIITGIWSAANGNARVTVLT